MRICVVGKYPPIQGGVSAQTYWLARGLAERGHDVHVVSNAQEIEPAYRMELSAGDREWHQPDFRPRAGHVAVHLSPPYTDRTMFHIPEANPFVTKLAGLATEVIAAYDCAVVFGHYFEPYCVAAWMASTWTGRPLVVTHAGSDLERLMRVPALAATYKRVLRSADAVVTSPALMSRFVGMGVRRARLHARPPFPMPTAVFNPEAAPLDLTRLRAQLATVVGGDFDPALPTVGFLGKIGVFKGTLDLIQALGLLAREGVAFNLLALIGERAAERLARDLNEAQLTDRTAVLPLAPHWRVPEFIRACTAVCFLERDFPIAIHASKVPAEVLACGTCLVVSQEMASKRLDLDSAEVRGGVVIVPDPKDHAQLADALRPLLLDPDHAAVIGRRGHAATEARDDSDTFVRSWEEILVRASERRPNADPVAPSTSDLLSPFVLGLARKRWPDLVARLADMQPDADPFAAAIELCDQVLNRLSEQPPPLGDRLEATFRYQRARLMTSWDGENFANPVLAPLDDLGDRSVVRQTVLDLVPLRTPATQVEQFDYDLSPVFSAPAGTSPPAAPEGLATLAARRSIVGFHRAPNLASCELRLDESTRELLAKCDGSRTTREVIRSLCEHYRLDPTEALDRMIDQVLPALSHLHRLGVVAFRDDAAVG
jgi:glycosyltransferase involved in cell wall biosynthesis